MNSTPAVSKAKRILVRLIVGIETSAAVANCSCDQAKSERAALICLIDTFGIDIRGILMRYNVQKEQYVEGGLR